MKSQIDSRLYSVSVGLTLVITLLPYTLPRFFNMDDVLVDFWSAGAWILGFYLSARCATHGGWKRW